MEILRLYMASAALLILAFLSNSAHAEAQPELRCYYPEYKDNEQLRLWFSMNTVKRWFHESNNIELPNIVACELALSSTIANMFIAADNHAEYGGHLNTPAMAATQRVALKDAIKATRSFATAFLKMYPSFLARRPKFKQKVEAMTGLVAFMNTEKGLAYIFQHQYVIPSMWSTWGGQQKHVLSVHNERILRLTTDFVSYTYVYKGDNCGGFSCSGVHSHDWKGRPLYYADAFVEVFYHDHDFYKE